MPRVVIAKKAHRQLRKLPKVDAAAIFAALAGLSGWPDVHGVKALSTRREYRLRIGDYRAIFQVEEGTLTVTEVKRRNEHTY